MKVWILAEHQRRIADDHAVRAVTNEARELAHWVRDAHPAQSQYRSPGMIENMIQLAHREAGLSFTAR